jgi:ElaA protein
MEGVTIACQPGRAPDEAVAIRRRVFIEEQGVPEADELDGKDAERTHFLARDAAGHAIGCACLRPYGAQHKVERVAVLPELRGTGLGRDLMSAVEAHARSAARARATRAGGRGGFYRSSAGRRRPIFFRPASRIRRWKSGSLRLNERDVLARQGGKAPFSAKNPP